MEWIEVFFIVGKHNALKNRTARSIYRDTIGQRWCNDTDVSHILNFL